MGRYGQAILTIVGTVVGAYFGYPALGAFLGSLAGGLLFPTQLPTVQGARLSDLTQTTSTVGTPLPRGWGTFAVAGTVIWQSDLREQIAREEVGGKGSSTQTVETPEYYQDFSMALCEGEDTITGEQAIGGVRRIWANGKLIYDRRPQQDGEEETAFNARIAASDLLDQSMVIYLGTETQEPDPTMEAALGLGEVPAFRGLAYIVFVNWKNKAEDGNRMPLQWKFEVYTVGAQDIETDFEYSNDYLPPWNTDLGGSEPPIFDFMGYYDIEVPATGRNFHRPGYRVDGVFATLGEAKAAANAAAGRNSTGNYMGYSVETGSLATQLEGLTNLMTDQGHLNVVNYDVMEIVANYNVFAAELNKRYVADYNYTASFLSLGWARDTNLHTNGPWTNSNVHSPSRGGVYIWFDGPHQVASALALSDVNYDHAVICGENIQQLICNDARIRITRKLLQPGDQCAVELPDYPGYCISTRGNLIQQNEWESVSSSNARVLAKFATRSVEIETYVTVDVVDQYPLNPALPVGHSSYSDQAFWETAYQQAVAAGQMPSGLTYGTHYPKTVSRLWRRPASRRTITTDAVPMGDIVHDLMREAGYESSQFDRSALDAIEIIGYVRTRPMAARAALEPLRTVGFWDAADMAGVYTFVPRGGAIARTLTDDDLGARYDGENPGPMVSTRKVHEMDLPRCIRLHYISQSRDYEAGEQPSPTRIETEAENDTDVEIAVVMTDDQAAQVAEIIHADAWASRWIHEAAVGTEHLDLFPTDVIGLPVDGQVERSRITAVSDALPSVRKFELARDDDGNYVSTAVADPVDYLQPPALSINGPTEMILLDLPVLRAEDNNAGIYAALRPYLTSGSWSGAVILRSTDQGASYQSLGPVGTAVPMGYLLQPLESSDPYVWDEANTLNVQMQYGDLESRSEADVLAGANAAAVGADGRWLIIQFRNAVHLGDGVWQLSGLLQGRRGTEHNIGTSLINDRFVMLSMGGLIRLPMSNSAIGVAYYYKAVGSGTLLADAVVQTFTGAGVALKPFSPVHLNVERQTEGDLLLTAIRRERMAIANPWGASTDLSEATEAYEIDIVDTSGDVVDTIESTTASVIYPLDDQTRVLQPAFDHEIPIVDVRYIDDRYVGIRRLPGITSIWELDSSGQHHGGYALGVLTHQWIHVGANIYVAISNGDDPSYLYRLQRDPWTRLATYIGTRDADVQGVCHDGTDIWVSEAYSDQLVILDELTLVAAETVPMSGYPTRLVFEGGDIFVCLRSHEIAVVDAVTRTETLRFSCVATPVDAWATTDLIFVQGIDQLGVYDRADGSLLLVHENPAPSVGGGGNFGVLEGQIVAGVRTGELLLMSPTTGAEVERRSLPDFNLFGGVANDHVHMAKTNTSADVDVTGYTDWGRSFDNTPLNEFRIDWYQLSAVVGRGYVGSLDVVVSAIEADTDVDVTPEVPLPDDNAIILPLTFDEIDQSDTPLTWTRLGDGPRITDRGMLADGYEARLVATASLPAYITSLAGPLMLRVSVQLHAGARNATADVIASVCENDGSPNPKLEFAVVDDPSIATEPNTAFRTYTASMQTQRMGRKDWNFAFTYPIKTSGGFDGRPQGVLVYGEGMLITAHYEDQLSLCHYVSRETGELINAFQFDAANFHVSAIADRESDSSIWFCDFATQYLLNVDVESSFGTLTADVLAEVDMTALNGVSAIEFAEVYDEEYFLVAEYQTAGTAYLYLYLASECVDGAVLTPASRIKRLVIPLEIQGIVYRNGVLYMASSNNPVGGVVRAIDLESWIGTGSDGDTWSTYDTGITYYPPTEQVEDIDFDEAGDLWAATEGETSIGDDTAFSALWCSSLEGTESNVYSAFYDGAGSIALRINDRDFATLALTPTVTPAAISVGGPVQAAAGETAGFFVGTVRNVVVQENDLVMNDPGDLYQYEQNGSTNTYPLPLINAGAEAGDTSAWTDELGALAVRSSNPDPYEGAYYFSGGTAAETIASQRVAVADMGLSTSLVDYGICWAVLEWAQATFAAQADTARLGFRFLDETETEISEEYAAAFAPTPSGSFVPRSYGVAVPVNTRYIEVLIDMVRVDGVNNDGYVDDIRGAVIVPLSI